MAAFTPPLGLPQWSADQPRSVPDPSTPPPALCRWSDDTLSERHIRLGGIARLAQGQVVAGHMPRFVWVDHRPTGTGPGGGARDRRGMVYSQYFLL